MNNASATANKIPRRNGGKGFFGNQRGFNVIEFLIFVVVLVLAAIIVVPNINLFFGKQTTIDSANVEAASVRAAANSYEINTGKYPANSNALWSNPAGPDDYIAQPRAFYTFDIGTGRILTATINDPNNMPANPWVGIQWNFSTDSWAKQ